MRARPCIRDSASTAKEHCHESSIRRLLYRLDICPIVYILYIYYIYYISIYDYISDSVFIKPGLCRDCSREV